MQNMADSLSSIRYYSPRLLKALDAILSVPLTVVEAPMGYGKTVAIREFVQHKDITTVWVSILDNLETDFWRSFCVEISKLPDSFIIAVALLRLGVPFLPDDDVRRAMALELLSSLKLEQKTILVIDDVHLLNHAESCILFFEALAEQKVKNLHIVLITRNIYTGNIILPSLKGELNHIDSHVLAFTKEDIRNYYTLFHFEITDEKINALHNITKGWISGLYLLCRYQAELTKQSESQTQIKFEKNVFALSDSEINSLDEMLSRGILPVQLVELLEDLLFKPLATNIQNMLLTLSIFEQFTKLQAEFCINDVNKNTQEMLNTLVKENAFITYDATSGFYTIQAIFRNLLLRLFNALPTEKQNEIHLRAGRWFTDKKEFLAAMEQYYLAKDFEKALSFMELDMSRNLIAEQASFFDKFFKDCPQNIYHKYPFAIAKYAFVSFFIGNTDAFDSSCTWLRQYCARLDITNQQTRTLRGELEMLLSLTKYNDIEAMSSHHHKAWELLGRPSELFPPEASWTSACPSILFMFHKEGGKLQEEIRKMYECMPPYYKVASSHSAGGELLFEAEALYLRGEFNTSYQLCCQAEIVAAFHNQAGNTIRALYLHAKLALVRRDTSIAKQYVQKMREHIINKQDFFLLYTIEICSARIFGLLRENNEIPAWIRDGVNHNVYAFAQGKFRLAQGRALLLANNNFRLIKTFNDLLKVPELNKYGMFFIYVHVFLAAAFNAQGKNELATEALNCALDAAIPDCILMPFVENSDFIFNLLEKALAGKHSKTVEKILELSKTWLLQLGFNYDKISNVPFILSAKQYEIAILAARGLSSTEIAGKIGLRVNTVNTHLKAIYKKCKIHSRQELRELYKQNALASI